MGLVTSAPTAPHRAATSSTICAVEALGGLFILAGFALALAGIGCMVWTLVHLGVRPTAQFRAARQSRLLWVVLVVGGFVLQPLGFLASIVYVTVIRPKVDRAAVPPAWGQPAQ